MCASRRRNTSNAACRLRVGGLLERRKSHRVIELVNKLTREFERVPHLVRVCVSETRRICGAADLTWCCVCWRCDLAVWRCLPSAPKPSRASLVCCKQWESVGGHAGRRSLTCLAWAIGHSRCVLTIETTPFRIESHRIAFFALISFTSSACCR